MTVKSALTAATLRTALDPAAGLALILLCLLAGEQAAARLPLGLPGQIVGLAALCGLLSRAQPLEAVVAPAAQWLLRYLPLLILPAGVGSVFLMQRVDALGFAVGCAALAAVTTVVVGKVAARLLAGHAVAGDGVAP